MRLDDWKIDTSCGRDILTYKGCSVIEDKDAWRVLEILRSAGARGEIQGRQAESDIFAPQPVISIIIKDGWPIENSAAIIVGAPELANGVHELYTTPPMVLLPPVSDLEPDDIDVGYNICHYLVQHYLTQQGIAFRIDVENQFSELKRNQKGDKQ